MSKIVFTADIHFGVPGRLDDILFACNVIKEYCTISKIDTVIVLGDMFHDRRSLAIDVITSAYKFLESAVEAGQQWITFPGNHDMFLRHSWEINSLTPLDRLITVIEDIKLLQLDDQRFWVLPFIQYEKSYMKVAHEIMKKAIPGDKLLTHIGVRGATLNTCFLLKDWSYVTFDNSPFERIYTGHFHSKQQVGNVYYPGSPIPFKFDEGDVSHGFIVYDTETNDHKFVDIWKAASKLFPNQVAPPQFMTITAQDVESIDADKVRNNMIRIILDRDYTTDERKRMSDKLKDLQSKAVRWMNVVQKDKPTQLIQPSVGKNLFESWIDNDKKSIKDLDGDLLRQINKDVTIEGDELYSIEDSEV